MNDLPPDLPRLRTIETWLALQLQTVRQAITAAERRAAEQARGQQARPPAPDWLIEQGLNRNTAPVYVHAGDCWNAGKRAKGVPRDVALRALAEGVAACPHCRPDTQLGVLD